MKLTAFTLGALAAVGAAQGPVARVAEDLELTMTRLFETTARS